MRKKVELWQLSRVVDKIIKHGVSVRRASLYHDVRDQWWEARVTPKGVEQGRMLEPFQAKLWRDMYPKEVVLSADAKYGTFYLHMEVIDKRFNLVEIVKEILENAG